MQSIDTIFRNYNKLYANQQINKEVMVQILNKIQLSVFLLKYSFSYSQIFQMLAQGNSDPTKILYNKLQQFVYDDIEAKTNDFIQIDINIYLSVLNQMGDSQVISRKTFEDQISKNFNKLNKRFYQVLINKFTKSTLISSVIDYMQKLKINLALNSLEVSKNPFQTLYIINSMSHLKTKKIESSQEFFDYLMLLTLPQNEKIALENKIEEYKQLLTQQKMIKTQRQSNRFSSQSFETIRFSMNQKQQQNNQNYIIELEKKNLELQKTIQQINNDRKNQNQTICHLQKQLSHLKSYNKELNDNIKDLTFDAEYQKKQLQSEKEELLKEYTNLTIKNKQIKIELDNLKEINQTYKQQLEQIKNQEINQNMIKEQSNILDSEALQEKKQDNDSIKKLQQSRIPSMSGYYLNNDNPDINKFSEIQSDNNNNNNRFDKQIRQLINNPNKILDQNPQKSEIQEKIQPNANNPNKILDQNPQKSEIQGKIQPNAIKPRKSLFYLPVIIIQLKNNNQTRILYLSQKEILLTLEDGRIQQCIKYEHIKQLVILKNENWIILRLAAPENRDILIETFFRNKFITQLLKFDDFKIQKENIKLYPENNYTIINFNKNKLFVNEMPQYIMHPMRQYLKQCSFGGPIFLKRKKGVIGIKLQQHYAILNQYLIVLYKDFDMKEAQTSIAILQDCEFQEYEIKNLKAIRIMYHDFPYIQQVIAFKNWQSRDIWFKILKQKVIQLRQQNQTRKQKLTKDINAILNPPSIFEPVPI